MLLHLALTLALTAATAGGLLRSSVKTTLVGGGRMSVVGEEKVDEEKD